MRSKEAQQEFAASRRSKKAQQKAQKKGAEKKAQLEAFSLTNSDPAAASPALTDSDPAVASPTLTDSDQPAFWVQPTRGQRKN